MQQEVVVPGFRPGGCGFEECELPGLGDLVHPRASCAPCEDVAAAVNTLDVIYETVADLCRADKDQESGGWVKVEHVAWDARCEALTGDEVYEAIDNWIALGVMSVDPRPLG